MNLNQLTTLQYGEHSISFISKYDGVSFKIWNTTEGIVPKIRKEIREHYVKEQKYFCSYCRCEYFTTDGNVWTVEHILPKSKYPQFLFEQLNIAMACRECNRAKNDDVDIISDGVIVNDIYPSAGVCFKIIHPHYDKYSQHMELEAQGKRLIHRPLDDKGKLTYVICNLKRFSHRETNGFCSEGVFELYEQQLFKYMDEDEGDGLTEKERGALIEKLKSFNFEFRNIINRDFL
ncbi:HNH endonuclease [Raoultella ornithinolytica]